MISTGPYDVFIGAAVLAWLACVPLSLRSMRLPLSKGLWPAYAAVPLAFFGARLFNVLLHPENSAKQLLGFDLGSFTLYGGLLLGAAAALLLCIVLRLPKRRYFDTLAPLCGIGIAVSRVGCILNGCCFGLPTRLPWGITPTYGGAAHAMQLESGQIGTFMGLPEPPLPIHPTQVYELAAALLSAGLAVYLIKKRMPDGVPAAAFGLSLSVFRLLIFFARAFPDASGLSLFIRGPVTFGTAILFFAGLLFRLMKCDREKPHGQTDAREGSVMGFGDFGDRNNWIPRDRTLNKLVYDETHKDSGNNRRGYSGCAVWFLIIIGSLITVFTEVV